MFSSVVSRRNTVERGRSKRRASSGAESVRLSRLNSHSTRSPRSSAGTL